MFWSYIYNFKKILGHIQNQRALIRLQDKIRYQQAKNVNSAFHSLIKNDRFKEFDGYIHQNKEGWTFIHPFGGRTYFINNCDMETFYLTIKASIAEETIIILHILGLYHIQEDMFDMSVDRYELPKKEEIKSKWYWFKQIFFSEEFLVLLVFFVGIISALISGIYSEY